MTYVKQARTPTLIQHGDQDARVPIPNAFELFQGLRDQTCRRSCRSSGASDTASTSPRRIAPRWSRTYDWFTR